MMFYLFRPLLVPLASLLMDLRRIQRWQIGFWIQELKKGTFTSLLRSTYLRRPLFWKVSIRNDRNLPYNHQAFFIVLILASTGTIIVVLTFKRRRVKKTLQTIVNHINAKTPSLHFRQWWWTRYWRPGTSISVSTEWSSEGLCRVRLGSFADEQVTAIVGSRAASVGIYKGSVFFVIQFIC